MARQTSAFVPFLPSVAGFALVGLLCPNVAFSAPPVTEPSSDADADADAAAADLSASANASGPSTTDAAAEGSASSEGEGLSAADRDALKAELKAELLEELRRENAAMFEAEAESASESAEAAAPAPEGAEAEDESDSLVPPNQDMMLGKHPIANDKNTYKPGSGMHLESADGRFALTTRLRAQMLYTFDADHAEEGDTELEQFFQIRRARLQFKGHAFNEHNKMKIEFAFSPRDLNVDDEGVAHNTPLLSWYWEFDYLRDFTIRMGQYKIPYSRQRVVSSGDQELVDRALAQGEFNHDRDIGFDFRSKDVGGWGGRLRYYAGVYMGEGRDFGDRNGTQDFRLHYLARLEVLPMGKFDDYSEADIEREMTPKLSLGGAFAFHDDAQRLRGTTGSRATDGGTTDYLSATADYAFKWKGFSSTGEFHWRRGTRTAGDVQIEDPMDPTATIPAPVEAARNGLGWFVQAGYLIPRIPLGIAARYSQIRRLGEDDPGDLTGPDGSFSSLSNRDEVGGGLSYYFGGHAWKIQADYFRRWDDDGIARGSDGVRVQAQLAF